MPCDGSSESGKVHWDVDDLEIGEYQKVGAFRQRRIQR